MVKKISHIKLLGILAILVLVFFGLKYFKQTSRSSSFRETLVDIDTAKVTALTIEKSGNTIDVTKSQNGWEVTIEGGKKVEATKSSVNSALASLMTIVPSRIATKDPEKWRDYQVDSAGTRIKISEGSKNTLDLIIGRFGVHGRQQFHTFVRIFDENEVYAADNFMGISFPSNADGFRNSRFLQIETDSINQVVFNYPVDSSFILSKQGENWMIGQQPADSAQVAGFISDLRYASNRNFVDDVDPAVLISPTLQVDINLKGGEDVSVKAYSHPAYGYIFHSGSNPKNYFSDDALLGKIFRSSGSLINPAEEE
ncbi:DUF4340 domain-containing protein [Bacteroidota bacterium]